MLDQNISNTHDAIYLLRNEKKYSPIFKLAHQSQLLNNIWRDAYQEDFPEQLETFGFVTKTDLNTIAELINIEEDGALLDIGCGKGGPGMFVADKTKAKLIGIDIDENAVNHAKALKEKLKLGTQAAFQVGSFRETHLPSLSIDAIMSVDALILASDKNAAINEMGRLLRERARFVFTTWDRPEIDLQALLKRNGFRVLYREETPNWKARQLAVYQNIRKHKTELRKELGEKASRILISEAIEAPALLSCAPRVLFAAEKH